MTNLGFEAVQTEDAKVSQWHHAVGCTLLLANDHIPIASELLGSIIAVSKQAGRRALQNEIRNLLHA